MITIRGLARLDAAALTQIEATGFDLDQELLARPDTPGRSPFPVWHVSSDGSRLVPWYWLKAHAHVITGLPVAFYPGSQWVRHTDAFHGQLRENQLTPVADLLHLLRQNHGAMLRADCGVGKTVMGLWTANELEAGRVAILVDQVDLADQWVAAIKRFMPEATYAVMGGGHKLLDRDTDVRFRIMVGQSLWRQDWADDPMVVDLLLVDEAHVFAAPCFFRSLTNLCFTKSVGLTATPDRRDKLEWIVTGSLGSDVAEATARLTPATIYRYPIQTVVNHDDYYMAWCRRNAGMTTKVACQSCEHFAGYPSQCGGHLPVDDDSGLVSWGDRLNYTPYIQAVISDPNYHGWLLDVLLHLVEKRRHTLVFGQFQTQLLALSKAFEARRPGQSGLFFGKHAKAGKASRGRALDRPITFCTYGVAQKGLDVPWKDAAVFASPLRDIRQPRGRIERMAAGKTTPIVIDPIHTNSPILRALAHHRHASYAQAQCHVIDYPGL